ncbi:MAG: cation diffusion facilitator family transporter [Qingshengfaniella sp.]
MGRRDHTKLNLSATGAAVAMTVLLVTAKLWALDRTGSLSVAASLVDSALDLMASLAGLAAIAYAARPPDDDHSFGHTAVEDLATLGQALFILVSAGFIALKAVERLAGGSETALNSEGSGIAVMILSLVLSLGLVLWQSWVLRTTSSPVVAADRLNYLGDTIPNFGALVALWVSGRYGIIWIDSAVALGAAAFLGIGALRIGREAWHGLMDREPDPALAEGIGRIAGAWPGIEGFHDLRMRRSGSQVFVNLHVEIDGTLSLVEAHAIGAGLRAEIERVYPQTDVLIHKDPAGSRKPEGKA